MKRRIEPKSIEELKVGDWCEFPNGDRWVYKGNYGFELDADGVYSFGWTRPAHSLLSLPWYTERAPEPPEGYRLETNPEYVIGMRDMLRDSSGEIVRVIDGHTHWVGAEAKTAFEDPAWDVLVPITPEVRRGEADITTWVHYEVPGGTRVINLPVDLPEGTKIKWEVVS